MTKFSIIIPVYNVEQYIKKCLDSVFAQTFKDYEVIVVNDGTKDNSMDIVKDYKVKVINQENQGLSEARNVGVKNATGEYLVFLDSDDYIKEDLLKEINNSLSNKPDVVRYQAEYVVDGKGTEYHEKEFTGLDGKEAFDRIVTYHYVEPAWLYAVKRKYYIDNKFSFKKKAYHEDYGLTPLIIFKSKVVNSIDYCGYCYIKREGSIITAKDYNKTIKKVEDTFNHYRYLKKEASKLDKNTETFNSFIANNLILKVTELKGKEYKEYKKLLKEEKVYDDLLSDTKSRRIKKGVIKKVPKIYYKLKG